MEKKKRIRFLKYLWITVWGLFSSGLFIAPYLSSKGAVFGKFLYYVYGIVCHQKTCRSFEIFDNQVPVCSRCSGVYLGFVISGVIYCLINSIISKNLSSKAILVFSGLLVLPLIIDGSLALLGIGGFSSLIRFITGILFASGVTMLIFYRVYE